LKHLQLRLVLGICLCLAIGVVLGMGYRFTVQELAGGQNLGQGQDQGTPAGVAGRFETKLPYTVTITTPGISITPGESDFATYRDVINLSGLDTGLKAVRLTILNEKQLEKNFEYLNLIFIVDDTTPAHGITPGGGEALMALTLDHLSDTTR